jgi:dTMP kinase
MLPETEMLLYMASRSQHTGQWILPALKEGRIVISDRYYDSTIAYQGAARKVDLSTISTITEYATYGTVPDVTFLLDLPVEIGVDRIQSRTLDRLELENREFHEKVRQQYLQIADSNPDRYVVLNGEDPVELIHQVIRQKVLDIMTEKNMILVKDKTEL